MADLPMENDLLTRAARAVRSFVESPIINLVKGLFLVVIGCSEAFHTLRDDITNLQPRVGHGLVLIGFFSILDSVPQFIEGLEASKRYVAFRKRRASSRSGTAVGLGGPPPPGPDVSSPRG
jgi:hypothetical protein